ncbi:hypothetical protein F5887DRAFT_920324 [Amanita rubescens]|nr:hypothetical protein F5887DRAFT_920324 [Amanita rubescens]
MCRMACRWEWKVEGTGQTLQIEGTWECWRWIDGVRGLEAWIEVGWACCEGEAVESEPDDGGVRTKSWLCHYILHSTQNVYQPKLTEHGFHGFHIIPRRIGGGGSHMNA